MSVEQHELVADDHAVALAVEPQLGEAQRGLRRHRAGTAQQGLEPGLELAQVERAAKHVVGTGRERVEPAVDRVRRGEHQHGHGVAGRTQAAAHLEAVDAGHAAIEDDRVGATRGGQGEPALAVVRRGDLEAGEPERPPQRVAQRTVAGHHEDQHGASVAARAGRRLSAT